MTGYRAITLAAAVLFAAACAPAVRRPVGEQILAYRGRDVEAVLVDGRKVRLVNPQVTADSVYGAWAGDAGQPTRAAVALADIRSIRVASPSRMQREMAREARREAVFVLLAPFALLALLIWGQPAS